MAMSNPVPSSQLVESRVAHTLIWLVGLAVVPALILAPELGFHAFWVLMAAASALLVLLPGRNVGAAKPARGWPIAILLVTLGGCDSSSGTDGPGENEPPAANVFVQAAVTTGQVVGITGAGSTDPEGAALSFRWVLELKPAGSAADLQSADERAFLQPDLSGTYQISLIVNDGIHDSVPARTEVEATAGPGATAALGPWQTTTELTFSSWGAHDSAAFAWNGYMYLTGGQYGSRDRIQRAPIHSDGTLGAWVDMATLTPSSMLPIGNQDHLAMVYQPPASPHALVYIVGGWSGGALAEVHHAPIHADGTLGAWTTGLSLYRGRHGHGGAIVGSRIYIFGGWSAGALESVEYADIGSDGSLTGTGSTWTTAPALPQLLTFPAGAADAASSHPGPWVLGGENTWACPNTAQDTVYRATSGATISWEPAGTLPEPLFDLGAVFTRNTIIITGGAFRRYDQGATSCPWEDASIRGFVYLASIDAEGTLGTWYIGPDLPAPRADHNAVHYGDYLYILGGRSVSLDGPYPTEVWFARVL